MKKVEDVEHLIDIDSSEEEDDNDLYKTKPKGGLKPKDDAYKELQEQQIKGDDEPLAINPSGEEPTSSGVSLFYKSFSKICMCGFYKFVFLYYTHIF